MTVCLINAAVIGHRRCSNDDPLQMNQRSDIVTGEL